MNDSDLLLTIAEVAVGFAGFASLVAILGQRSSRDDPRVLAARMRGMIFFSLLAIGASLVPFILQRYGLDDTLGWRLSSALFAMTLASIGGWLVRAVVRMSRIEISRPSSPRVIGAVLFSCIGGGVILLGLNALIIPPHLIAAVYMTGLGLTLFLAGFAFCLIVFAFLPDVDSP